MPPACANGFTCAILAERRKGAKTVRADLPAAPQRRFLWDARFSSLPYALQGNPRRQVHTPSVQNTVLTPWRRQCRRPQSEYSLPRKALQRYYMKYGPVAGVLCRIRVKGDKPK